MTGSLWTAPRIADRASGRDNNFNLLRILAAVGVLVSHAYPISLGPDATEPLSAFLGGPTLGTVSVMIFFSISGFFITRSFAGRRSLSHFMQARVLRLFPALIVVLMVTVLVSGLWLTTAPPRVFWVVVPEYILRNVTLFSLLYDLPGVFATNPYGPAINGSLWTLSYEVLCYLGVVLAGLAGLLMQPRLFAVALLGFIAAYGINMVHPLHPKIDSLLGLALPFAIGMSFWVVVPEYILRNVTLFSLLYDLPGVFATNPYGPAINGSLWTLSYEVLCYLGVVLAGLAGLLARPQFFAVALLGFIAAYGINMVHPLHPRIDSLLGLALPFAIGMSFWVWRRVIPLSVPVALILLACVYLSRQTAMTEPVLALALAYTVFVIGYAKIPTLAAYNRMGDYSYGTYVYAFPIQQMLAGAGVVDPLSNMALALPATVFCAILSWHLIEAPAMRLKVKTPRAKSKALV